MAQAAAELRKIRPATVKTVMSNEIVNARGKFVSDQAVAKLSKCIGHGQAKPVPEAVCCADFRAMATVKYNGMSTVSEQRINSAVATQFVRPPSSGSLRRRRRAAGAAMAAGPGGVRLVAIRVTLLDGG